MSKGKIRGKILLELWANGLPMTLHGLSEKVGLKSSSTMGYLLGLIKAKYVSVPQKHYYTITNLGKQAIGLPKADKNSAQNILNLVDMEKAFYFYNDIDQPTGIYANSMKEFIEKIKIIDLKTIEFHVPRRDFEKWIASIGDLELAKKLEIIRNEKSSGENLRKKLYETFKSRYEELTKFIL